MKICNSDTRYLGFLVIEKELVDAVCSSLTIQTRLIEPHYEKTVSISWRFSYVNGMAKEVLGEHSETRFNYSISGNIDDDYTDCKNFLFRCYWDLQTHIINKYEIDLLCDFELENITCQIMEMIIRAEN